MSIVGNFQLADGESLSYVGSRAEMAEVCKLVRVHDIYTQNFKPKKGDVIIDIGAHVGMFARECAEKYEGIQVISVEADPELAQMLIKNCEEYQNIKCLTGAVCSTDGELAIFECYSNARSLSVLEKYGDSLRQVYETVEDYNTQWIVDTLTAPSEIKVKTLTVMSIMKLADITSIGLLKINTNGGELDILKGIPSAIWPSISSVVIFLRRGVTDIDAVKDLLLSAKFRITLTQNESTTSFRHQGVLLTALRSRRQSTVPLR